MDKSDYNDVYIPEDGVGAGRLIIGGRNTSLKLLNSSEPVYPSSEFQDHHGMLKDGSKASLLECVRTGSTTYGLQDRAQKETRYFPHYVIVGDTFVSSGEAIINAVHYHFENSACLVHTLTTFGSTHPEREEFANILKAKHYRRETTALKHGWDPQDLEMEIGDHPILQYYSGRHEIAQCDTEFGSVAISNRVAHGHGSSSGVSISNEITASLDFSAPTTIERAFTSLGTLHSFFELCLGRHQRYLWIELQLENTDKENGDSIPRNLQAYWSHCNDRISGKTPPTQYGDVLLDAGARQLEFQKVVAGWLNTAADVGNARNRFAQAFHSKTYGVDRIVSAANMFDLLPSTHVPSRVETDKQTAEAVENARRQFRALPNSFARQSVLSALGRVGMASLRDKICHRADVISHVDRDRFAELHLPCSQAVLCRNHFVHGSEPEFDYIDQFSTFAFLVDTLEFVFAVSDLIELGWDYDYWRKKGSSLGHDFGSYIVNYDMNLRRLKGLIDA